MNPADLLAEINLSAWLKYFIQALVMLLIYFIKTLPYVKWLLRDEEKITDSLRAVIIFKKLLPNYLLGLEPEFMS